MMNGVPPYKGLLTHGFFVDGEGRKMSKSKGNMIAPQEIAGTLGAETLRLWVASTDYSGELSISGEILKRVVESYRRIRNTLRFLLANTSDFDLARHGVATGRDARDRSLRAGPQPRAVGRSDRRVRGVRVPPRDAAPADLVLGGPRGLLPRHPERPVVYGGARLARAALRADCAASHHPHAAASDGAGAQLHRRGSLGHRQPVGREHFRARLVARGARRRGGRSADVQVAPAARNPGRGGEGARIAAREAARSALRCRPKS